MKKLNPIKIIDNQSKFLRVKDTTVYLKNEMSFINVETVTGIPIQKFSLNNGIPFISLSESLQEVYITYLDETGEEIDKELLSLLDMKKEKILTNDEIEFNDLKLLVQEKMNMLTGTELEASCHTELLKKATIDEDAKTYVISKIRTILLMESVLNSKIEDMTYKLYADLYGMGVLQELDDDIEVGEIMVNAQAFPVFKCQIFYIKNQVKYKFDKTFDNLQALENVFRRSVEFSKKELNQTDNAMIEAIRTNRDRVNIIIPDASENWILNIRKFSNFVPNLNSMKISGTVNEYIDKLFNISINGLANIGIGGYMGTGKTTMVNYLLTYSTPISRKVLISSISEIDIEKILKGHDVFVLNVDDEKGFTFEKHLKYALRTTADRIVVPEARAKEFRQIYEANIKTSGNLFTGHAFDDESFLDGCVEMYKSDPSSYSENSKDVKLKISKSLDLVIIMRKVGKSIRIKSISEVVVDDNNNINLVPLIKWSFNPNNPNVGQYEVTGAKISDKLRGKFNENGIPFNEMEDI